MGAWIEIGSVPPLRTRSTGRPRMGAWIEIRKHFIFFHAPFGRPRMGAWIEILSNRILSGYIPVAPVWGHGLKSCNHRLNPTT